MLTAHRQTDNYADSPQTDKLTDYYADRSQMMHDYADSRQTDNFAEKKR